MKAKNNENILGFYEVTQGPDKTRPTQSYYPKVSTSFFPSFSTYGFHLRTLPHLRLPVNINYKILCYVYMAKPVFLLHGPFRAIELILYLHFTGREPIKTKRILFLLLVGLSRILVLPWSLILEHKVPAKI